MAAKRERSWFLAIFGLPFFGVGVGFLVLSVIPSTYEYFSMQSWPSVQGTLLHAELESHTSDGSTSYEALARYSYVVAGQQYRNDRVAIQSGADNIGSFQQDTGYTLQRLHDANKPVLVFYNPENPADSILFKEIRWGLIGFKMIFVLVFGGMGLGLIVFGLRGKAAKVDTPEARGKLWLEKPEWSSNEIRSGAKTGMYGIWAFALIWNLISFPMLYIVPEAYEDEGAVALLILLFPLVGVGMLYWAIKATLEWKRFGPTPLRLDPFPGSIGGDVGGEILLNMRYEPHMQCEVTLSCIYSYMSGSGKNRSRSESAKWQDTGYAKVVPAAQATRLQFRFAVPSGLPESQEHSDRYHLWRLNVNAKLPGADLNRSFEIPVFDTGAQPSALKLDTAGHRPAGMGPLRAEDLLPLQRHGAGVELLYPAFSRIGTHLMGMFFGSIFAGAGFFMWAQAAKEGFMLYFMGGIFSLVGVPIVLYSVYSLFSSMQVNFHLGKVSILKRLAGFPVGGKELDYKAIRDIQVRKGAMSSQSGGKHQVQYNVVAKTMQGDIVLAKQLDSHSKAKLVCDYFLRLIGRESMIVDLE